MSQPTKAPEAEDYDFKWGKKRGVGGKSKNVQFYQSFSFDGDMYSLFDDVYLYKDGEPEPYIGKLVKIWEHKEKRMVKVLWFFRPVEIHHWLEQGSTLENELLLASGDGPGLADVNPLEAIAGKCNVVCTSKDSRNPQPSPEEVSAADYIFYRTFDVGTYTISDKICDSVLGVNVKFLLNRKRAGQPSDVVKVEGTKNEEANTEGKADAALGEDLSKKARVEKQTGNSEGKADAALGEDPSKKAKVEKQTGNSEGKADAALREDPSKKARVEKQTGNSEGKADAALGEDPSKKARVEKQTGNSDVTKKASQTLGSAGAGKTKSKPPKAPLKVEKRPMKVRPDEKPK